MADIIGPKDGNSDGSGFDSLRTHGRKQSESCRIPSTSEQTAPQNTQPIHKSVPCYDGRSAGADGTGWRAFDPGPCPDEVSLRTDVQRAADPVPSGAGKSAPPSEAPRPEGKPGVGDWVEVSQRRGAWFSARVTDVTANGHLFMAAGLWFEVARDFAPEGFGGRDDIRSRVWRRLVQRSYAAGEPGPIGGEQRPAGGERRPVKCACGGPAEVYVNTGEGGPGRLCCWDCAIDEWRSNPGALCMVRPPLGSDMPLVMLLAVLGTEVCRG